MAATVFQCVKCGTFSYTREGFLAHRCTEINSSNSVYSESVEGPTQKGQDNNDRTQATGTGSGAWNRNATLLLLEEYRTRKDAVEKGKLTKKAMWSDIGKVMQKKGYSYTDDQISGQWKSLNRAYKVVKDNNTKSGKGRKSFEYEDEMDNLLEGDPTIQPPILMSSRNENNEEEKEASTSEGKGIDETSLQGKKKNILSTGNTENTCKRKRKADAWLEVLKDQEEKKSKRHREKMNILKSLVSALTGQQPNLTQDSDSDD